MLVWHNYDVVRIILLIIFQNLSQHPISIPVMTKYFPARCSCIRLSFVASFRVIKDYKCQSEFFGDAYTTCQQRIVLDNAENAFGHTVARRLMYIGRCVFNAEKDDLLLEILNDVRAVVTMSQGQTSGRTGRKL
jgi:hypothetical protein